MCFTLLNAAGALRDRKQTWRRVNGGELRKKAGPPGIQGLFSMGHLQWCPNKRPDVSAGSHPVLTKKNLVSECGHSCFCLGLLTRVVANIPWKQAELMIQETMKSCHSQLQWVDRNGHCGKWNKPDTRRQVPGPGGKCQCSYPPGGGGRRLGVQGSSSVT